MSDCEKYRNKDTGLVVEAIKWDGTICGFAQANLFCGVRRTNRDGTLTIRTPEGKERVGQGQWIIKAPNGRLAAHNAKYFEEFYELVIP